MYLREFPLTPLEVYDTPQIIHPSNPMQSTKDEKLEKKVMI